MTDDKTPPNENDRPEQAKPSPADQQIQQRHTSSAAQPEERPALGRRPLFRS
jgi:hypothetical protein